MFYIFPDYFKVPVEVIQRYVNWTILMKVAVFWKYPSLW